MQVYNLVVALLLASAVASSAVPMKVPNTDTEQKESEDIVTSALGRAIRGLSTIQNIASQPNIELLPGVTLESDNPASMRNSRQLMNMDLPFSSDERLSKMIDMVYDIFNNFFSGRTLKIKVPKISSEDAMRALEEGRKLKKKMMSPIIMAIGAKLLLLVPLLLGGLALLAVKAAVVAKIALVLALFAGAGSLFGGGGLGGLGGKDFLSKFGGGGNGGWSGYGGGYSGYAGNSYSPAWNSVAQGGPYARSGESAQDIAYSAQKP